MRMTMNFIKRYAIICDMNRMLLCSILLIHVSRGYILATYVVRYGWSYCDNMLCVKHESYFAGLWEKCCAFPWEQAGIGRFAPENLVGICCFLQFLGSKLCFSPYKILPDFALWKATCRPLRGGGGCRLCFASGENPMDMAHCKQQSQSKWTVESRESNYALRKPRRSLSGRNQRATARSVSIYGMP